MPSDFTGKNNIKYFYIIDGYDNDAPISLNIEFIEQGENLSFKDNAKT